MSVINTNITSMISQKNLNTSKNSLTTAMERLSSGMRINSAKDDAAGQAIANRMTAQVKGLAQAQRNANDGISVAQTAEGALNQINDNLQRIRELTVQAANGTNSGDDLTSIQNEIGQRLNEINRISEETNFNGTKVLASNSTLKIQVGAKDSETIDINLQLMNKDSIGVGGFSVKNMTSSDNIGSTAVKSISIASPYQTTVSVGSFTNADQDINVTIGANSVDLTDSAQDSGITALGVYNSNKDGGNSTGFVVKASDGKTYDLKENGQGGYFFDSSAGASTATGVSNSVATTSYVESTKTAVTTALENVDNKSGDADFFSDKTIYRRNDVTDADIAAGNSGYAIKGDDGNYYALELAASDTDADSVNDTATFSITGGSATPANWVQVSSGNISAVATAFIVGTATPPSVTDDLYNIAVAPSNAPTADGLYALADNSGYVVKGSDNNYYTATVNSSTGAVSWKSSTGALDAATVNTGAAVTKLYEAKTSNGLYALDDGSGYVVKGSDSNYYAATVDNTTGAVSWDSSSTAIASNLVDDSAALASIVTSSTNQAAVSGLSAGEALHELLDDEGNATGKYVVKGTDVHGNTTYNDATVAVNGSNQAVVTKGEAKTVDALATLDSALSKVDALRSDLGAIQNRFESAITNLRTNETNLTAARSRIEDADYAVEVANMTRGQILQQAGTSVLAQANQVPQGVLSLLR